VPELAHTFVAPVLRQNAGFRHHYILLPPGVADAYHAAGVRRLAGSLNGVPIRRAIQVRDGEAILVLG
jgi:hypothetical protein